MSRVDVIVPCYNYAHYLRECVESILSQEGVDVRVLIIDDCSPDNTAEVAAELKAADSRIESLRHPRNIGHIATYNEGLEWASGDYVLLLSADDALIPGALARASKFMDQHPELVLTYGRVIQSENMPALPPVPLSPDGTILSGQEFLEKCCKVGYNPVPTPTVVVRTSTQKKVGGYRSQFPHAGDLEMWLRLGMEGDVGRLHSEQAFKRRHSKNMYLEYMGWEDIQQVNQVFQSIFLEFTDRIAEKERLSTLANQSIAQKALEEAHNSFGRGDVRSCRRLLRLALEKDSALCLNKDSKKLKWKLRLGFRTWSLLGPMYRRLRVNRFAIEKSNDLGS